MNVLTAVNVKLQKNIFLFSRKCCNTVYVKRVVFAKYRHPQSLIL